jgi:phosphoglycerate kinase
MKQLRPVEEIGSNSNVILRLDTDLPIKDGKILDNGRLIKSLPTIRHLLEKNNKIIIVGHLGRPEGVDKNFSLKPVYAELMSLLENDGVNTIENVFVEDIKDTQKITAELINRQLIFVENLRFFPEEEAGDTKLFEGLKIINPVFVNDAFAVAHRKSASILLFKVFPAFYGFSFIEEAKKIGKILEINERPLTLILGGAKEDKLKHLNELVDKADYILIGGKLPKLVKNLSNYRTESENTKILMAELNQTGLDLSNQDIKKFKEIIEKSKIIIWAGAMGFYESDENKKGTEEIAKSVANSSAYKIIAGGDTGASIANLGLKDKIDFICSGGGVMLEFLAKGTLPAWE